MHKHIEDKKGGFLAEPVQNLPSKMYYANLDNKKDQATIYTGPIKNTKTSVTSYNAPIKNSQIIEVRLIMTLMIMKYLNKSLKKNIIIEKLKYVSIDEIKKNSQILIDIGILPPFEKEHVLSGGDELNPLGRNATKRKSKPSTRQLAAFEYNQEIQKRRRESIERKRLNKEHNERLKQAVEQTIFEINDILEILQREDAEFSLLPENAEYLTKSVCNSKIGSEFMKILFPEDAISQWCSGKPIQLGGEEDEEDEEDKSRACIARKIWELTAPQQQCKNVIGEFEQIQNKNCYICGFEIKTKEEAGPNIGLLPECEHILPIIQAMFFLDLYRPNTTEINDELKFEYTWSHRSCNRIKGDTYTFLQTNIDETTKYPYWTFNETLTTYLLYQIIQTDKHNATPIQKEIRKVGQDKWISQRLKAIRTTMDPILGHIQSKGNGGVVAIMGLRNCLNVNKLNERLRGFLGNYGYNPGKMVPINTNSSQGYWFSWFNWINFFRGGTRSNKKRSLKIMKGGEKRQRTLAESDKEYQEMVEKRQEAASKRRLTKKLKRDVDDLADMSGKMETAPNKEKEVVEKDKDIEEVSNLFDKLKYGGKKRRVTRKKSKKVSKQMKK